MSDFADTEERLPVALARQINVVCNRFEAAWQNGSVPRPEDYLKDIVDAGRSALLRELVVLDILFRQKQGDAARPEDYQDRFPELGLLWLTEAIASPSVAIESDLDTALPPQVPLGVPGTYELLERLGQGNMGLVWKARQKNLNKIVALKMLAERRLRDGAAIERFRREMETIGQLDHPNIVRALHAEMTSVPYLAMEFVEGIDLAQLVRQHGPLPIPDACELVRQAALGLQHAHEHGVIHRDIKPSNLMLATGGKVKVLDLGLARLADSLTTSTEGLTEEGVLMGTPDYMAPEQLLDAHTVDGRADLYSLGCTLHELLLGQPPFPGPRYGTRSEKRQAHLLIMPPSLSCLRAEVPAALSALVERFLAKDPEQRFQTAAEVAESLRPFAAGSRLIDLIPETMRGAAAVESQVAGSASTSPRTPSAAGPLPSAAGASRRRLLQKAALVGLGLTIVGAVGWSLRPPPGPLRIVRFEVLPYRQEGMKTVALTAPSGTAPLLAVRRDHYLRVKVEFSEPAYCYLLSFNADGAEQLCYPFKGTQDQPPKALSTLVYPEGTFFFRCSDGVGLQAFVLLASRQSLPTYASWKERVGALPWGTAQGDEGWRFAGDTFEPLSGVSRAPEEARPVPGKFMELCRALQERGGGEVLEALVFPIGPREGERP